MPAPLYLCIHVRGFHFRDMAPGEAVMAELLRHAQRWTPCIEILRAPDEESRAATLLLDLSGSERLLGSPRHIATTVHGELRAALDIVLDKDAAISVAVSQNASAAVLTARGLDGIILIPAGDEAAALAPLPISVLEADGTQARTLESWGICTLGQLAALPASSLAARLGASGLLLQAQARARHRHHLVPIAEPPDAPLCESLALEHPIESTGPLLFLLHSMLERLTSHAAQRALAVAAVELRLGLDAATTNEASEHRLSIRPALAEREPRTLLKLLQLELDLHPPATAVAALHLTVFPAPPQRAQHGLFAAQPPEAGRLEILLARLRKLVGAGRVGSAELMDSHAPEAFRMAPFHIEMSASEASASPLSATPLPAPHPPALRILRPPRAVSVELRNGAPALLRDDGERFLVQTGSGPWRSSGAWWSHPEWCREEWDVIVQSLPGAHAQGTRREPPPQNSPPPRCLRLAHDPASAAWYILGAYD
jgi:protein ImuB